MSPKQATAIDMRTALNDVVGLLRVSLPSSISLETTIEDNLPKVLIDPVNLHQIVMNLCANSRDAMEGSGRIAISARLQHAAESQCNACGMAFTGEFVGLVVEDSGPGMTPDVLARAFEPFYTTKAVGKGTGMGLALIHGVVHDAGGHVVVSSSREHGTAFSLYFPPALESADSDVLPSLRAERTLGHVISGHFVVVDDDKAIATLIGKSLEKEGCTVSVYTSSREALAALGDGGRRIDMLIADHTMPELTGVELIRQAAQLRPGMPTILMTGYNDDHHLELSRAAGASGFISKPFRLKEFHTLVSEQWSQARSRQDA